VEEEMHRLAHAFALLLVVAATAEAQQVAGTFDQLRVLVKRGDTLTVTDGAGQRLRGKLTDLSESSLVLEVSGTRRVLQGADVDIIEKRGSDSLKNGALIGLSIGAGLFGAAMGAATGDWGYAALGAVLYGGIGAGIGVGVDALIEGQRVIYAGSRSTRTSFNIAPILSRSRKGVLVTIGLGKE
jgi:hypothetical protein